MKSKSEICCRAPHTRTCLTPSRQPGQASLPRPPSAWHVVVTLHNISPSTETNKVNLSRNLLPMLDVLRMYITSDPATNPSASHLQGDIEKRRLYPQMSRSGIPLSAVPTKSGPFSRRIRHFRHIVAVIVSIHCPTFFIKFTDKDGKASYRSEGDNDSI